MRSAKAQVGWCCQRAAPGGGEAATTLQKRTLWKSVISAVSWPSWPTSEEIKNGKWKTRLPDPPCPATCDPQEAHSPLQSKPAGKRWCNDTCHSPRTPNGFVWPGPSLSLHPHHSFDCHSWALPTGEEGKEKQARNPALHARATKISLLLLLCGVQNSTQVFP